MRQFVELHGGKVFVENNSEGQGATFTVKIPLATVRNELLNNEPLFLASPEQNNLSIDSSAELAGLRILLVDDEADCLELLSHVLNSCGADITTAICRDWSTAYE